MTEKIKRKFKFSNLTDFSHRAMDWIGSVPSLVFHTAFFGLGFSLIMLGADFEKVLLALTTIVSLEAIYLAIFIQMAVNQNIRSLNKVEEDIDDIQEDVDEIQKDIDDIQEDVDEIQKDDEEEETEELQNKKALGNIESKLQALIKEIEGIRNKISSK